MRTVNIVERIAEGEDDLGFDRPCVFGHHIRFHAVYCHNTTWKDAPRKCWRQEKGAQDNFLYDGDDDFFFEDCPGFAPNPDYTGPTMRKEDERERRSA